MCIRDRATCAPGFASIKYQAFQVFAAQIADFMLTNYPTDTIDDITLSTAIGTNNTCDALIKIEYSFIGKTFKSFYF